MNLMVIKKDKNFSQPQFLLDLKLIRLKYKEAGYLKAGNK